MHNLQIQYYAPESPESEEDSEVGAQSNEPTGSDELGLFV